MKARTHTSGGGRRQLKTLLVVALWAGKTARNKDAVPEIRRLRAFGAAVRPPVELATAAAEVRTHLLHWVLSCCHITGYSDQENLSALFICPVCCLIITQAAISQAVTPNVDMCVAKLAAMDTEMAAQISQLRHHVHDIEASLAEGGFRDNGHIVMNARPRQLRKRANKMLHVPTMRLREGQLSCGEIDTLMNKIE